MNNLKDEIIKKINSIDNSDYLKALNTFIDSELFKTDIINNFIEQEEVKTLAKEKANQEISIEVQKMIEKCVELSSEDNIPVI